MSQVKCPRPSLELDVTPARDSPISGVLKKAQGGKPNITLSLSQCAEEDALHHQKAFPNGPPKYYSAPPPKSSFVPYSPEPSPTLHSPVPVRPTPSLSLVSQATAEQIILSSPLSQARLKQAVEAAAAAAATVAASGAEGTSTAGLEAAILAATMQVINAMLKQNIFSPGMEHAKGLLCISVDT